MVLQKFHISQSNEASIGHKHEMSHLLYMLYMDEVALGFFASPSWVPHCPSPIRLYLLLISFSLLLAFSCPAVSISSGSPRWIHHHCSTTAPVDELCRRWHDVTPAARPIDVNYRFPLLEVTVLILTGIEFYSLFGTMCPARGKERNQHLRD